MSDDGERDDSHLSRISDGYLALDADWTIVDASEPAAALVERSRAALIGATMWTAFPDGVDSRFEHEYETVLETGEPTTFRAEYEPLDTWFEVSAYPDGDGLAIYFRDVTTEVERARVSRRLNAATDRLHEAETVAETWTVAVEVVETVLDLPLVSCRRLVDGRLVPVASSDAASRYELTPVGPGAPLWTAFETGEQTVIDPGEGYEGVDDVLLFPLGEHGLLGVGDFGTVEYSDHLVESGTALAGHLTTALDRAVREERLRERERSLERYETIVEAAGDAIYWLDDEGCFQRVNDRLVDMSGYERDALVEAHASTIIAEADVAACERAISDMLAGDRAVPVTVAVELQTADGTSRYCEVAIAPLFDDEGVEGTVGVIRDRTDLKRREERLVVMDRVLRHNLRNKMNVVLGELDAIDDGEPVERIRTAAKELLAISDDARRFDDVIDPDGQETARLDLVPAVERAVEDFRSGFPEATLRLVAPDSATVSASPAIDMAVTELVENALTYGGERPTVTVSVEDDDEWVTVEVSDDGPGIDPEELAALETGAERPLNHASGLGLWLVSWTVESSGGDVSFDVGDGTTVRLRLPGGETTP